MPLPIPAYYDWSTDMPAACADPALEAVVRIAIQTATVAYEQVVAERPTDPPVFSGGVHASAKNDSGKWLEHEVGIAIDAVLAQPGQRVVAAAQKQAIIAYAFRCAHVVRQGGFHENGWAQLGIVLRPPRRQDLP